jgi:uncharacterized PurR-regulated membrane protein YhhQ (DUF165 family)
LPGLFDALLLPGLGAWEATPSSFLRVAAMIWVAAYIATIFAANWAIQTFGFVPVGFDLMAPAGVYFVGAAFTFRDLAHESVGRKWIIVAIVVGAGLSSLVSPAFALASGVAFLLSEIADLAVYTPLRERGWLRAVALSNAVGLVIDSALFLWLAFGSLEFLSGQVVGKTWMTVLAIALLWGYRHALSERRRAA